MAAKQGAQRRLKNKKLMPDEETDAVLMTDGDFMLRFPVSEIPEMKKNSRGVRGMKLGTSAFVAALHLLAEESSIEFRGRPVALNRLKTAHRDGKGSRLKK